MWSRRSRTEMQSGKPIYDGWINDSYFIGTPSALRPDDRPDRMDGRRGQGRYRPDARRRRLHRQIVGTWTNGHLYQLPDQQFANLYWFRYDWFSTRITRRSSRPLRLRARRAGERSAYEDIATSSPTTIGTIDGKKVYGHADYGKKDPSLGWRFTDAWLSMAGNATRAFRTVCRSTNGHPDGRMQAGLVRPSRAAATSTVRAAVYSIDAISTG